jgi:hypothetical protein
MFCPKCATQNIDGASFCRSCGANISLVPQALTGQLPVATDDDSGRRRRRKRRGEPSLDEGIRSLMMGIGFIVVSVMVGLYSPGGWTWWYWLLIPASAMIGKGVSQIVRTQQAKSALTAQAQPRINSVVQPESLRALKTGELVPPVPSVTEGTTRHLGAEARTRHFDSSGSDEKPT